MRSAVGISGIHAGEDVNQGFWDFGLFSRVYPLDQDGLPKTT